MERFFLSEEFKSGCLVGIALFFGKEIIKALLVDKFLRSIAQYRIRHRTHVGIQPLGIDFPVYRPALLRELIEECVG